MRSVIVLLATLPLLGTPSDLSAQTDHLAIKWVRDSEEYLHLVTQVYHAAAHAVEAHRRGLERGTVWAVVLDADETVLDNSEYQLERAAYALPFDTASWNAYVRREVSRPLPGVAEFLDGVRTAGGRVAFVTNRHVWTLEATRRNLAAYGLWHEGDLLCLRTEDPAYTKRVRRTEVRTGRGACGWEGRPAQVLAYIGDQMGDMPEPDEVEDRVFGVNLFLIPNPTYGRWERAVTR